MIQLVTQFDPPGILPGAAPQSGGACCCCCCCCCVVSTLAASVVTARSVGRPFVPDAGTRPVGEAAQPGAAAGAPRAIRGAQATTRHRIFAALLMPASAVLGVYAAYVMELPGAGLLGPAAWLLGLAWLSRRGLPWSTAVAVFVLGLLGFVAEAIIYYRIIVSS